MFSISEGLYFYKTQAGFVHECVCVLSHVRLFATPWTVAHKTPLSMEKILEWVAISSSRGFSQSRDCTHISCIPFIGRQIVYHCAT